ncbi:unnamed protein product [Sympodiomycopsis kandeliae]
MSEAVRAAVAARRAAAARSRSTSPVKQRAPALGSNNDDGNQLPKNDEDSYIKPFGSPKKARESPSLSSAGGADSPSSITMAQKSEQDLLFASCSTGRLNLSSRMPALETLPSSIWTLLNGEPPAWYEEASEKSGQQRRPWYEREDLSILSVANGELSQVSDRIGDFRGLAKLELQNNRLNSMPRTTFQLVNLTTLNLSRNKFTSIPACLFALDSLIELDLSHNQLEALWSDEAVSQARKERKEWDQENADEEGGIWAGFLERAGSPTKRIRPPPPTTAEQSQPMRSLRILNLSNNRLGNAALSIPTKQNKQPSKSQQFTWPPALTDLNLSDNMIRGPIPLSFVGQLKELKTLSLGGNGIADDVFIATAETPTTPFGTAKLFPRLRTLDLQRCEIDDLRPLEAIFGSTSTLFDDNSDTKTKNQQAEEPGEPAVGLTRRNLVRVRLAQDTPREDSTTSLYIVLENNPLREEAFRRKYGKSRQVKAAVPDTAQPESELPKVGNLSLSTPSPKASTPAASPSDPAKEASMPSASASGPAKEDWELQIEAGMYSEGAKRRMRAEAARAAAAASATGTGTENISPQRASSASSSNNASPSRQMGRRQTDGVNKTGLSDWDGSPSPSKRQIQQSKQSNGEPSQESNDKSGLGVEGENASTKNTLSGLSSSPANASAASNSAGGAGSTLANTKLTKRQSEALGRVPCKFFRSATGCSAGDACPFAHILPGASGGGDGAGTAPANGTGNNGVGMKSVCEFFIKGNCRFGHKCALAHVREGEPMSMDRKNKKAAQQGLKGTKSGGQQRAPPSTFQQNQTQDADHSRNMQQQNQQQYYLPQQLHPQQQYLLQQHQQHLIQQLHTLPPQQQQQQLRYLAQQQQQQQQHQQANQPPFYLPNQGQHQPPPDAATDWPSAYPSNGNLPPREDFSFGLPDDMQPPQPSHPSGQTTSGIGRSLHGGGIEGRNDQGASDWNNTLNPPPPSHLIGSPSAARAFGSSPFGQSVFYSGSQESEGGVGPFARSVGSAAGGRSFGARNGSFSSSSLRPQMGRLDEHSRYRGSLDDEAEELADEDDEEDGDHFEEDFLPSSLSDLLTPAELERRKRSAALGAAGRQRTSTQSMPAEKAEAAAAFKAGMMDLGGRQGGAWGAQNRTTALGDQDVATALPEFGSSPGSGFSFEKRTGHAPGQSLPRGLAAGLSRLHLAAASGQRQLSSGSTNQGNSSNNNNHLAIPSSRPAEGVGFSSSPSSSSLAGTALGRTPPRQEFGPVGSPSTKGLLTSNAFSSSTAGPRTSRLSNSFNAGNDSEDYGLGPTAPSSVLPHRPGALSSRLSSAFSFDGRESNGSYSQSPISRNMAPTPARKPSYAGAAGIAIGKTAANSSSSSHLQPNSNRAITSASSPLALPPSKGDDGEEEEVGVFELE